MIPNTSNFSQTNLQHDLIAKEIKYGGKIINVPILSISKHDPQKKDKISSPGMIGGDRMMQKDHNYAGKYAQYLLPFLKKKGITLIEIGILKGTGLAIWSDLFKKANIIGLDIDLSYFKKNISVLKKYGAFKTNQPKLFTFDQFENNKIYLNKILKNNKVDICIDDGDHSNEAIMNSLSDIKPFLSDDFVYFVEDNKKVHAIIKKTFPDFKVESCEELTIITRPVYHFGDIQLRFKYHIHFIYLLERMFNKANKILHRLVM